MVTKHCNLIDSPLSANNETPQKFLWWFAIVLSLKVQKQIFETDYYGSKREDHFFQRNFEEFNVLFDQLLQNIISMLCFIQISLSNK